MPRGPKLPGKKPEKPEVKTVGEAAAAPKHAGIGLVTLVLKLDERLDGIDRRLRQIMSTNQELANEVQNLATALTEQTALIEAEHAEVMAKLDELSTTGSVDATTLEALKAQITKVGTNNEAVKGILSAEVPPPTP